MSYRSDLATHIERSRARIVDALRSAEEIVSILSAEPLTDEIEADAEALKTELLEVFHTWGQLNLDVLAECRPVGRGAGQWTI